MGHPVQRALWEFGWHRLRSMVAMKQVSLLRAMSGGPIEGQTSIENGGCEAIGGLLHAADRRCGRAWSLPDIDQQHSRAALSGDGGAIGVMTCRS